MALAHRYISKEEVFEIAELVKNGRKRHLKIIIPIIIVVALFLLPIWASGYVILVGLLIFLYMSLGMTWNLLAGYAGLIFLGQQLFIGIGGYSLAITTEYYGFPILAGLIVGGIISAIIAAVESFLFFRMKGMYFAIATWVTAEAFMVIFQNWEYAGSGVGMYVKAAYDYSTTDIYYMSLVLAVIVFVFVNMFLRSKFGLGLMAMRDNYDAAGTTGMNLFKAKMGTFMLAGFISGITGGLFYLQQVALLPASVFAIGWTVAAVFIVIIGGIGTVMGPLVGAVLYVIITQRLTDFTGISMLLLGAIAIAVIILLPKGIIGTLQNKFDFELLSPRRNPD